MTHLKKNSMLQGLIELEILEKILSYKDCYIAINYFNGCTHVIKVRACIRYV